MTPLEIVSQKDAYRAIYSAALVFVLSLSLFILLALLVYLAVCVLGCAGRTASFWRFFESPFIQALLGSSFGGFAAYAGVVCFSRIDEIRKTTTDLIMRIHSVEMINNRKNAELYLVDFFGLNSEYTYNWGKAEKEAFSLTYLLFDRKTKFEREDCLIAKEEGLVCLRACIGMLELVGDLHRMGAIDSPTVGLAVGDLLRTWVKVISPFVDQSKKDGRNDAVNRAGVTAGFDGAKDVLKIGEATA